MKRLIMLFVLAMTLTLFDGIYTQAAMYPHPEVETEITVNEEGTEENNAGRVWNTVKGEVLRPDMEFGVLRYSVYLPEDYDSSIEYPILVYLHGGSMGYLRDEKITPWSKDLTKYSEPIAKCIKNCIILAPQAPGTAVSSTPSANAYWSGLESVSGTTVDNTDSSPYLRATEKLMEGFLQKGISYKENTYKVDVSRIYLAGHSMGGIGSFTMLRDCPDVFAAVIIGAGIGDPDTVDLWKNTPVRIYHGTQDYTIVYEAAEVMAEALKDHEKAKIYTLDANHNIKHYMYTEKNFLWMKKQTREVTIVTEPPEEALASIEDRDGDTADATEVTEETPAATEKQDGDTASNTTVVPIVLAVVAVIAVIVIFVLIKKSDKGIKNCKEIKMEAGIMLYVDCKAADVYEQIRTLKEIGVRHTFINAKHPELERVLEAVKAADIVCDNLHSEYRFIHNDRVFVVQDMCRPGVNGDVMAERIMNNIEKCAENNIPLIVIHPPYDAPEISINDYTRQRYTAIGDYARKMGVTVAFENLAYTRNLEYVMNLVPDAKFCWDCGHEYSRLKDEKPMPKFGKKLAALHIHDNTIVKDDHHIPYTDNVDFDDVGRRLAESGFDGTLMLEILYGSNEGNSTDPTYKDFAIKAKLAAERLIETVLKYRSSRE